jgi:hypothetical protein
MGGTSIRVGASSLYERGFARLSAPRAFLSSDARGCDDCEVQRVLDFVHGTLASGRRIRTLNVVDDFTRECLAIEVDTCKGLGKHGLGTREAVAVSEAHADAVPCSR